MDSAGKRTPQKSKGRVGMVVHESVGDAKKRLI